MGEKIILLLVGAAIGSLCYLLLRAVSEWFRARRIRRAADAALVKAHPWLANCRTLPARRQVWVTDRDGWLRPRHEVVRRTLWGMFAFAVFATLVAGSATAYGLGSAALDIAMAVGAALALMTGGVLAGGDKLFRHVADNW